MDADEFNAACEVVFNPNYRTSGFTFCPQAIIEVQPDENTSEPDQDERKTIGDALNTDGVENTEDTEPEATEPDIDNAPNEPTEPTVENTESTEVDAESTEVDDSAFPGFSLIENDVHFEGEIIGRLFDGKLKMVKGKGDLRAKTEKYLTSLIPQPADPAPEVEPLV